MSEAMSLHMSLNVDPKDKTSQSQMALQQIKGEPPPSVSQIPSIIFCLKISHIFLSTQGIQTFSIELMRFTSLLIL